MANYIKQLSSSNIKYLLALYNISPDNSGTRCVRIAEQLGITKPSVHTMVHTLENMGLVNKDFYGKVFLTDKGLKTAVRYNTYFVSLNLYFSEILLNKKDAQSAAFSLIADLSEENLKVFSEHCKSELINIINKKGNENGNS